MVKSKRRNKTNKNSSTLPHVLIVEDNLINQKVFVGILATANVTYQVVVNGQEAVDAVTSAKTKFDLILMDCQMPVMDGFEATVRIRKTANGEFVPIVAVTASALQSERQLCLKAGMDDFLSKPVTAASLLATVTKWTALHTSEILDLAVLREIEKIGENSGIDLLREIVGSFIEEAPKRFIEMQAALDASDLRQLKQTVHHYKSSCHCVGAKSMAALCSQIENQCDWGRVENIGSFLQRLTSEYRRVEAMLQTELSRSVRKAD